MLDVEDGGEGCGTIGGELGLNLHLFRVFCQVGVKH